MAVTTSVVETPHYAIKSVECAEHHMRWSPAELGTAAHVVLVQRGRFQLQSRGRRMTVDPTSGYLHPPGQEAQFSHPSGGDVCTSITLSGDTWTEEVDAPGVSTVRVDARLELAHRMLLRTHNDPDFAAVEAVTSLLQLARRREPDEIPAPGRFDLADRARDAILADDPTSTSLIALARLLETSPSHLSRTFRHHAGMSISRFRNRVRVSRALQRLDEGDVDLADLAITLGFSDQAHFTRIMRREVGDTPRRVRTRLSHGL